MAYDQTGLVEVNETAGTAGGRELIQEALTPTVDPVEKSMASLVDLILASLTSAATVAIDTVGRKIYFTDDAAKGALIAALDSDPDMAIKFTPDAGQTTKSLLWTTEGGIEYGTSQDPIEDVVKATRPAKSVASVISGILSAKLADETPALTPGLIIVDQINKTVSAVKGDFSSNLAALQLNAGNSGVLELSEPEVTSETKLPFEGGAT